MKLPISNVTKVVFIPNFTATRAIPILLLVFPCTRCTNCATKTYVYHTNWCYTVTQILANKIVITTFTVVPVKYGINHTAAMGIFVWAVKQAWYYS